MELSRKKKQQSQALSQSKLALQRKNANNFYVIKSFSHVLIALDQGMFSTTNIVSLDTSSRVYEMFPSIWKKYFAYHVGNYHWMENEDLVKMYERKKSKIFFTQSLQIVPLDLMLIIEVSIRNRGGTMFAVGVEKMPWLHAI